MTDPSLDREALIAAARGERELDIVLSNVTFVNVFTGELYPADIGIFGGRIAHIEREPGTLTAREVRDRSGLFALPGLIDTHMHVESSMLTPGAFAAAVLPHGTTTALVDPHELANVAGLDGVRYLLEASDDLPLRLLVAAPSCVPSAPTVETGAASFDGAEIAELLTWPRVVGLAEVMDYPGVLARSPRMMRVLQAAEGGIVQGHAPLLEGRDLSAYLAAGIDSDHETQRGDETLEKLRAGMVVEVRESSLSFNAAAIAAALRGHGYLPTVTLCSDDVTAEDLLAKGHIDHVARRLVEEGLDPVDVARFATLNAAAHLRRRDLGALAPGRIADVVLLRDLTRFEVAETYCAGRLVARDGTLTEPVERVPHSFEERNTVHVSPALSAESFRVRVSADDGTAVVRTIDYRATGSPKTVFGELEVEVAGGEVAVPAEANVLAVVDRHRGSGAVACALVRGLTLERGALATTVAHDCHQLVVLGRDCGDMLVAAHALVDAHGGIAFVCGGELRALIPLPVAGLLSTADAETVAMQTARFREVLPEAGLPPTNAFMGLVLLTLAVSPAARLSDLGLVDVATQTIVPLLVSA